MMKKYMCCAVSIWCLWYAYAPCVHAEGVEQYALSENSMPSDARTRKTVDAITKCGLSLYPAQFYTQWKSDNEKRK